MLARPLDESERATVYASLNQRLASLFFLMQPSDQRHSYEVFRRVDFNPELAEAALLHDVGKSISALGPFQRSIATVCRFMHIPVRGRWKSYLAHGAVGATMLEEAGAGALAVTFTRVHPGEPPLGVETESWDALAAADNA